MAERKRRIKDSNYKVWKRSDGFCENCSKQLYENKEIKGKQLYENKEIKEVVIEKWVEHQCWKCAEEGTVITIKDQLWLQDTRVGKILSEEFPFFYKTKRKLKAEPYYANHCLKCKALQGDWFILEWIIDESLKEKKKVEIQTIELPFVWKTITLPTDIQVYNQNEKSLVSSLKNIKLLCKECFDEISKS